MKYLFTFIILLLFFSNAFAEIEINRIEISKQETVLFRGEVNRTDSTCYVNGQVPLQISFSSDIITTINQYFTDNNICSMSVYFYQPCSIVQDSSKSNNEYDIFDIVYCNRTFQRKSIEKNATETEKNIEELIYWFCLKNRSNWEL